MAITHKLCNSFKEELLRGVHAMGPAVVRAATAEDTFKMALYTQDAVLGADTTEYTTVHEVLGQGYTAGGKELVLTPASLDDGVALVNFADPTWTGASFSAAGALIYNASQDNRAVAVLSFGGTFAVPGANFTVQLPDNTRERALIRIS